MNSFIFLCGKWLTVVTDAMYFDIGNEFAGHPAFCDMCSEIKCVHSLMEIKHNLLWALFNGVLLVWFQRT